ncbi:MAG: YggT family protein [Candidatus Dormibacteria bacterium]
MAVVDAVLGPVVSLLLGIMNLLVILIIIRVVISYLTVSRYHPVVRAITQVTDLVIQPARRLPHLYQNIDFAPVIASVALVVGSQIIGNLYSLFHAAATAAAPYR